MTISPPSTPPLHLTITHATTTTRPRRATQATLRSSDPSLTLRTPPFTPTLPAPPLELPSLPADAVINVTTGSDTVSIQACDLVRDTPLRLDTKPALLLQSRVQPTRVAATITVGSRGVVNASAATSFRQRAETLVLLSSRTVDGAVEPFYRSRGGPYAPEGGVLRTEDGEALDDVVVVVEAYRVSKRGVAVSAGCADCSLGFLVSLDVGTMFPLRLAGARSGYVVVRETLEDDGLGCTVVLDVLLYGKKRAKKEDFALVMGDEAAESVPVHMSSGWDDGKEAAARRRESVFGMVCRKVCQFVKGLGRARCFGVRRRDSSGGVWDTSCVGA